MTDNEIRERAEALVKKHGADHIIKTVLRLHAQLDREPHDENDLELRATLANTQHDIEIALLAARQDATLKERERCILIVQLESDWTRNEVDRIVRAIRNPPAPEEMHHE